MRRGEAAAGLMLWAAVALGQPADPEPSARPPAPPTPSQGPAAEAIQARPQPKTRTPSPVEEQMMLPTETVDANDVLDEILDEFAADMARLGSAHTSPVLLQRVRVSDNMNPDFAQVLEARMVAALEHASSVAVIRCFECFATRSRVENATWVVSRGITDREELTRTAARYGARMLLSAVLTLYTNPNSLALDVELVKADDGTIAFAEGYRVHPNTAQLLRSGDRAQKREERLKDLEERLNQRPQFGTGIFAGAMLIPSDSPNGNVVGAHLKARMFEKFGMDREWWLGLNLGGFTNPNRFSALTMGVSAERQVTPDDIYLPSCHAGGFGGYMVTVAPDGSTVGTPLFGAIGECIFAHRFAIHAGVNVVVPFQLGATGFNYGGVAPEGGAAVLW
ncbi:MAG TPA: hypothetical protein VIG99_03360 [Myxococcaceae bacterium]|jgi:hypothetical protein